MLAIVITLAVSLSTLPAIQTEPACYYVSDSVGLGCSLYTSKDESQNLTSILTRKRPAKI